jgi:hypothetical protein
MTTTDDWGLLATAEAAMAARLARMMKTMMETRIRNPIQIRWA